MVHRLSFVSSIPRELLYDELSKEFAKIGWEPRIQGSVLVVEDGKSYSKHLVAFLVILGFLLLLVFFVGFLFWMFAAAYYAGAEKRKVLVSHTGNGLFEATCSDGVSRTAFLNILQRLTEKRAAEQYIQPVKLIEQTPEQVYKDLLEAYRLLYGTLASKRLERDVEKLEKMGLSREEAIKTLREKLKI